MKVNKLTIFLAFLIILTFAISAFIIINRNKEVISTKKVDYKKYLNNSETEGSFIMYNSLNKGINLSSGIAKFENITGDSYFLFPIESFSESTKYFIQEADYPNIISKEISYNEWLDIVSNKNTEKFIDVALEYRLDNNEPKVSMFTEMLNL